MRITPEILLSVPLFADLDEIELVQVMACFSLQKLVQGETLYAEGARATTACFIVNGELEAVTALPGGGEAVVGLISPGDMIGEMALIAGGARTATVRLPCRDREPLEETSQVTAYIEHSSTLQPTPDEARLVY